VKKISLCDDNSVEKLKKQPNFYAKGAQIRFVFFTNKPMIFFLGSNVRNFIDQNETKLETSKSKYTGIYKQREQAP
jgi:hypothetical protein